MKKVNSFLILFNYSELFPDCPRTYILHYIPNLHQFKVAIDWKDQIVFRECRFLGFFSNKMHIILNWPVNF